LLSNPSLIPSIVPPTANNPPSTIVMASNLVEVTSPDHFKQLLSADLNRVSCLNFWAPWAEPCAAFNKDIEAAAKKYPSMLFLNVGQTCLRLF
jgi:thiol-disulfide isomerase/thioredoxin